MSSFYRRCTFDDCRAEVPHGHYDAGYCKRGHFNEPVFSSGGVCECGLDKVRETEPNASRRHTYYCPKYKAP